MKTTYIYTSQLSVLLKAKGTTVANFYRRLLQSVHTTLNRGGGENGKSK